MVTREELPGLYRFRPDVIALRSKIADPGPRHLQIKGLAGSADAVLAAAVSEDANNSQLFILTDKEEAAYLQNNLESLLGADTALLFPSSYKSKTGEIRTDEPDSDEVLQRTEVLNRINREAKRLLIVSYPEAVAEKVVTRKNLVNNSIELRVGEKVSIDFITEFLLHHSFSAIDFVTGPGEFSVRGGIV